ncbi:MAG: fibronectin type III domain-containing protein [Planctomycetes bacterium]|nr:fibronectin type III domain-containing protein [Planctomycetota bacterium]
MRLYQITTLMAALVIHVSPSSVQAQAPAPPTNLEVTDHPWDGGKQIDLSWDLSPDDAELLRYEIYKAVAQTGPIPQKPPKFEQVDSVPAGTTSFTVDGVPFQVEMMVRDLEPHRTLFTDPPLPENQKKRLKLKVGYVFQVVAIARNGSRSTALATTAPFTPTMQWFEGSRFYFSFMTLIICGAVVFWIYRAKKGRPIKVRKIAGLEAVDEAVGRATEMGRSVLFIPGIQDINEIQTIAGLTILARVAKTAAAYGAKVEVPTSKSLVMTTARETVQAAFLEAGRPDAYNKDLIYYVTDEQFGYVAYLQGMMVREKPATCFYMGAFFAESLILAETGNSIGAIQIAGTAMPAQLPFFVAACDYTLIGEEFFAASAYLSGEPEQLGSLKGQDVGKVVVAILLLVGVLMATLGVIFDNQALLKAVAYLKETILT